MKHQKIANFLLFVTKMTYGIETKLSEVLRLFRTWTIKNQSFFCSRTRIVNETGKRFLGYSYLYKKPPSFKNAIVQNIAGGNTMMINRKARQLIISTATEYINFHDWWAYIIVSAVGGHIIYDQNPTLDYRQHSSNVIGYNQSVQARLIRIVCFFEGRFSSWNEAHIKALKKNNTLLTRKNAKVLKYFEKARYSSLPMRIYFFIKSGVYRQTIFGNLGLLAALLSRKL